MSYTPPVYPDNIPTETGDSPDLPDRVNDIDWLDASRYNELKKELIAVMTTLGTNPEGDYDDVKERLDSLGDSIPTGLIAMWSGTLPNIPDGWALCDGTNGTPNLLDKFIKSVPNNSTNPGSTGGSDTTGSHTLTTNEIPAHTHDFKFSRFGGGYVSMVTNTEGTQYTDTTESTGGGAGHTHPQNDPPYYELAFIIKTAT